jgi:hypothetical protein
VFDYQKEGILIARNQQPQAKAEGLNTTMRARTATHLKVIGDRCHKGEPGKVSRGNGGEVLCGQRRRNGWTWGGPRDAEEESVMS